MKPLEGTCLMTADLAWLEQESKVRVKIRECHDCGFSILVPTVSASHGRSYVRSKVLEPVHECMFCHRARRLGKPARCNPVHRDYDLFEVLLDECGALGMQFFMPTGSLCPEKPGDPRMFVFPATEYFTPEVAQRNTRFIQELAERYAHFPAFAGWYISDEKHWRQVAPQFLVNDMAAACRRAKPGAAVMMTAPPAHTVDRDQRWQDPHSMEKLDVDIFIPMDAGHYTHLGPAPWSEDMWQSVRRSHEVAAHACAAAGTRHWPHIELFYYDHESHGMTPFSAGWQRVKRQIEIASDYGERLSCCQYFALMDAPDSPVPLGGEGAVALHEAVAAHNKSCAP